MTRIFWDTILLISGTFSMSVVLNGSLFTFGAGHSGQAIIDAGIDANATVAVNATAAASRTAAAGGAGTAAASAASATDLPPAKTVPPFEFGADRTNATIPDAAISIGANSTSLNASTTTNTSLGGGGGAQSTPSTAPVKKFVAAAVRSHFDDCPDSHRHFCFHGTCRFLILEDTPACVCHAGFVGMRCEHADLLAVVATNHRQQTVATVLVLCVIGCVFIMLMCTLLNCWWRQECRRRGRAHLYIQEKSVNMLKHGGSRYPSESVV